MALNRQRLAVMMAKDCVARTRGGLMIRTDGATTILNGEEGILNLKVVGRQGERSTLLASTSYGSMEVAEGTHEEMQAIVERAWSLSRKSLESTGTCVGLAAMGFVLGVALTLGAMWHANIPATVPSTITISSGTAPAVVPPYIADMSSMPPIRGEHPAWNIPVPSPSPVMPETGKVEPSTPSATGTTPMLASGAVPASDAHTVHPTFQELLQRLMEKDPAKGNQVVGVIGRIAAYVRQGQDIPEELLEAMPSDILQRMVEEAVDAGSAPPHIRPKGAPATASKPPAETGIPDNQSVTKPQVDGAVQDNRTSTGPVASSTSAPSQSQPTPLRTVQPPSSRQRPLVWGGPNGESVARDRYGIPMVPETGSRASRPNSIELPGLGGGDLHSTTDLRSFQLPTE